MKGEIKLVKTTLFAGIAASKPVTAQQWRIFWLFVFLLMQWQLDGSRTTLYSSTVHPEEMTFDQPSQNLHIGGCESHPWMSIGGKEKQLPQLFIKKSLQQHSKLNFMVILTLHKSRWDNEWQLVHPPRWMCIQNPFKSKPEPVMYFSADWNSFLNLHLNASAQLHWGMFKLFWAKCIEMPKNFWRYWIWKQASREQITNTLEVQFLCLG